MNKTTRIHHLLPTTTKKRKKRTLTNSLHRDRERNRHPHPQEFQTHLQEEEALQELFKEQESQMHLDHLDPKTNKMRVFPEE